MTDILRVQELVGYTFRDRSLLKKAFTHTSYANENCANGHRDSNQRLEFLGDSVLSIAVSTYLYENFPEMTEGELSRFRSSIVCEETLFEVASFFSLGDFILLGRGERSTGGDKKVSLLADCVEALIAAVYLDSGFGTAERFVLSNLGFAGRIADQAGRYGFSDHKSALQEFFHDPDVNIVYELTGRSGPDHAPLFESSVTVKKAGELLCFMTGSGSSKKASEQAAAGKAMEYFSGLFPGKI